ncbi:hypothetical protein [Kamptonema sp. UHCC 0994]|uniref:hypothetical protein n=1 Tax=Kamptonema sp. UHCC 0994 TaxID=3031329 RepID=UPI0023B96DDB|nr:hypothetical protein [Kamptonema sp. UHCC 0994]MDF0553144.1 hypothetical protein [Kamptonema sp. UHCC 0994]
MTQYIAQSTRTVVAQEDVEAFRFISNNGYMADPGNPKADPIVLGVSLTNGKKGEAVTVVFDGSACVESKVKMGTWEEFTIDTSSTPSLVSTVTKASDIYVKSGAKGTAAIGTKADHLGVLPPHSYNKVGDSALVEVILI